MEHEQDCSQGSHASEIEKRSNPVLHVISPTSSDSLCSDLDH